MHDKADPSLAAGGKEETDTAKPPAGVQPAEPSAATQPGAAAEPRGRALSATEPPAAVQPDTAAEPRGRARAARVSRVAIATVRHHWLVSALLAAGLVLRVLTQIAYRPALIYVDTLKYLYGASPGADPLGYRLVLKAILVFGDLGAVAAIQHLLGLAMAVALYVVLLRRGAPRWLAALAVAPVLLDAYQLQMEQMAMPDVWFEAMIVAGLAVLLWRPVASVPFAVVAGLILGSSATLRQVGELLILPAVIFLLASGGGWRRAITSSVALTVAFALPILGYMGISDVRTGHFWLARGQSSIGRMAYAADCATLKLPAPARSLCPTPAEQANGPDWLEHSGKSPLFATPVQDRQKWLADLSTAVKTQQPARVVVSILRDSVRLFALTRDGVQSVTPISRWQFQTHYPTAPPWVSVNHKNDIIVGVQPRAFKAFKLSKLKPAYGGKAHVDRPVASFLRSYQLDGGYTPGPLLALCILAGVAASLLVLLRRKTGFRSRQLALGSLLFTVAVAAVLVLPDILEFSWRYQLPAVIILPPAGALGIAALVAGRRFTRQSQAEGATEAEPSQA
ncbi:MAG TPA: hypothetical protein VGI31_12515 [Streptosporangiaceae bacterium]